MRAKSISNFLLEMAAYCDDNKEIVKFLYDLKDVYNYMSKSGRKVIEKFLNSNET